MKKLLYFASDFKIGLSALLCDQLISICQEGADCIAVAGHNEQEHGLLEMLENHNIKPIIIHGLDEHENFKKLVGKIQNIVKENNIDIIHVQNNWQLLIAGTVKNKLRFKRRIEVIYTLHGFRHNSPVKSRIAQAVIGSGLFLLVDHIICMTKYLKRKFTLLSYKIELIPLGVKEDFFIDKYIAPSTDALHLIFPAQFRKGKNQDVIIRVFAKYLSQTKDSNSTLTLPGNGPLLNSMKDLVKDLGVEKQVIFPEVLPKDEIKKLYLQSNIAIVASNSETFGQSIVEPFVLGRCVISTPVGIATEIINEGENGYIFRTEKDLTKILTELSENKGSLVEIGLKNFNKRHLFNWKTITEKYVDILLK